MIETTYLVHHSILQICAQKISYKYLNLGAMKNEELQLNIVLKKNTQMAAKLGWYRRENQQLRMKNENLNTWVENLSEVFACFSSAWQEITLIEEALQTLLKKKADVKDQIVLRKYMLQFNTFASIINNLGDKIKNDDHSSGVALDAKEKLKSFVKNYEIFLKQLVDNFFKYNEQYSQLLNQMRNKPDLQAFTRNLMTKQLENRQKIKEFESFMAVFKEQSKIYEAYNQHALLDGVIKQKDEQIASQKQMIYQLERRVKRIFDYNSATIDFQIQVRNQNEGFQCFCGGTQIAYMKQKWEEHLKNLQTTRAIQNLSIGNEVNENKKVDQQKYILLEEQKQSLIQRNSILLEKIDKLRLQFKLTDEAVLKSNIYQSLKAQCQYLLDYVSDLVMKVNKYQQNLHQIEKIRQEEIRTLKRKIQSISSIEKAPTQTGLPNNQNPLNSFKTNVINQIQELRNSYQNLAEVQVKPEKNLTKNKDLFNQLKRDNEDINKRLKDLQNKELAKTENLEFRHEKFKQIENKITPLVLSDCSNIKDIWQQFLSYVKGRDKKIKDLQSIIRKKERQLSQKAKVQQIMNSTLEETQKVFLANKKKLDKTEEFITKVEKELIRLAEENFHQKTQFQQQRNLLTLKLKTQIETKNKLQSKVNLMSEIQAQINEIRLNQREIQLNYEKCLNEYKQKMQNLQKKIGDFQIKISLLQEQISERNKQFSKLQNQKQNFKSEIRELKGKLNSMRQKSEEGVLKMELQEYRNKIMCVCTGDREKSVVLKTCPHLWCKKCIEDTTNNRNRACPKCRIKFTKSDVHQIQWN